MEKDLKKEDLKELLYTAKITEIKRTCDLVMFTFLNSNEVKLHLHAVCFLRICKDGKILACTEDLFRRGEKAPEDFSWDEPGTTLFEDCMLKHQSILYGIPLASWKFQNFDFIMTLENGVQIELFANTAALDEEFYRFYLPIDQLPTLVIES